MMGFDCNTTGNVVIVCYVSGADVKTVEYADASNAGEFKQQDPADVFLERRDELRGMRERIGEVSEIHDAETRAVLEANRGACHPAGALIFQPCWSSRRWKSLT